MLPFFPGHTRPVGVTPICFWSSHCLDQWELVVGPKRRDEAETMEVNMEYCLAQVVQKDLGRKVQVGQELIDYILDKDRSQDLEQDQTGLDRMVDSIATTWVNCSNFKVRGVNMQSDSSYIAERHRYIKGFMRVVSYLF